MGKVPLQKRFDDLLQDMHQLVEQYAEERNLLKLQNAVLQNEIKHWKHQFELLQDLLPENYKHHLEKMCEASPSIAVEDIVIPKKVIAWFNKYLEALDTNNDILCGVLLDKTPSIHHIQQMKQHKFEYLLELMDELLTKKRDLPTNLAALLLTICLMCEDEREVQIQQMLLRHPHFIQENVQLLPLQLQFLLKYHTEDDARRYFETALSKHAEGIAEMLQPKAFAQLFWLAFLLNIEATFLSLYENTPMLRADSRTALYFKLHHPKTTDTMLATYEENFIHAKLLTPVQIAQVCDKIAQLRMQHC